MKKFIVFLLGFLINIAIAQNSIGLSKSKDPSPIRQYQLPTWSYSYLDVKANLDGNGIYPTSGYTKEEYDLTFGPNYSFFKESEYTRLKFKADLIYNGRYQSQEGIADSLQRNNNFQSNIFLWYNNYWKNDLFYDIGTQINTRYSNYKKTLLENDSVNIVDRETDQDLGLQIYLGLGKGRIRNVRPVIRALRIKERLKSISEYDLSQEEVQLIAQHFAQKKGYEDIYDRPAKYFYKQLYEKIENSPDLSPYDIYYLADVLKEYIGNRKEGWETAGGLTYLSSANDPNRFISRFSLIDNVLRKNHGLKNNHNKDNVGLYLRSHWAKNLTLSKQIGLNTKLEYLSNTAHFLNDNECIYYFSMYYLWNIADRIFYKSNLRGEYRQKRYDFYLRNTFRFYIENNVSLVSNLTLGRGDKLGIGWTNYWKIGVDINYHIKRHLF